MIFIGLDVSSDNDDRVGQIIEILKNRFGRLPTEDEVLTMIYGDSEQCMALWNKEVKP